MVVAEFFVAAKSVHVCQGFDAVYRSVKWLQKKMAAKTKFRWQLLRCFGGFGPNVCVILVRVALSGGSGPAELLG